MLLRVPALRAAVLSPLRSAVLSFPQAVCWQSVTRMGVESAFSSRVATRLNDFVISLPPHTRRYLRFCASFHRYRWGASLADRPYLREATNLLWGENQDDEGSVSTMNPR